MKVTLYFVLVTFCYLIVAFPTQAVTNLLVNGDFETGNTSNWTVTGDINLLDFISHWLDDGCAASGWCENWDLNFSGTVNFNDFAILAGEEFGTGNVSVVSPPGDNQSSYSIKFEPNFAAHPGLRQQSTTNFAPETLYQFSLRCLVMDQNAIVPKTAMLDPVADTYIYSAEPTATFANATYTDCFNFNNGSGITWMKIPYYQYILPDDFKRADSARFRFYVSNCNWGGPNHLYMVKNAAAQGNANTFTWNNAPGNNPADTTTYPYPYPDLRTTADSFYTNDIMEYNYNKVGQYLTSTYGINGAALSELNTTGAGNKVLFYGCYYFGYYYAYTVYNWFASLEDTNPSHPPVQLELNYFALANSTPLEMAIGYMDGDNFIALSSTVYDILPDAKTQWQDRLIEYQSGTSGTQLGKKITVRITNKSVRDIYIDNCELFTPNLYTSYHGQFEGLQKNTPEFDITLDSNHVSTWHEPAVDANWYGTYPMKVADGNVYIGYCTNVTIPRNHMARSPDGGNTWYENTIPYYNGLATPYVCSAYGFERILFHTGNLFPQYFEYADVNATNLVWLPSYAPHLPGVDNTNAGEPATNSIRIPRNQRLISAQEDKYKIDKRPGIIYSDDCAKNWGYDGNLPPHPTINCWRRPTVILSPDGLQVMVLSGDDYGGINDSNDGIKLIAHRWLSKNGLCTLWASPEPVSSALSGDGHYWAYDKKSGRLVINLRDVTTPYEHANDNYLESICWVGTWDDIIYGRDGQYRVKIFDNPGNADWYSGMTSYAGDPDDDTLFIAFYHHRMCRFTLPQMDAKLTGGMKLHLPMDEGTGSLTEDTALYSKVGPNLSAVLNNGAAWISGVPGLANALSFDGINDYGELDTNGQFKYLDPNTDSFSLAFWMKTANTAQTNKHLLSKGNQINNDSGYSVFTDGGYLYFRICDAAADSGMISGSMPVDSNWHHYAFIINRSTNQLQGYLDGNPSAFTSSSIALIGSIESQENLHIASSSQAGIESNFFSGSIDDIKILDKVITAAEAKGLARNMVIHFAFDEGDHAILSNSALMDKPYSGTWVYGGYLGNYIYPEPTWQAGHSGSCVHFNESRSQFVVREKDTRDSSLTPLDPQNDSFSVAFWYKLNSSETSASLASKGCNSSINQAGWRIYISGGYLYVRVANDLTSAYQRIAAPTQNEWHHVAMVINRDENKIYGYSDGNVMTAGGTSLSTITTIKSPQLFFMAMRPTNVATKPFSGDAYLNGWLDEVKIYRKPLSAVEVSEIYNE